jgi:hypothetical protein
MVLRIDFHLGSEHYADKTFEEFQVLCVRGGPFGGRRFVTYTANNDLVVRDTLNGLEWQRCAYGLSGESCASGSANTIDWKTALSHCEALSYAGHTDWRLPDRAELVSLVNLQRMNPSTDAEAFPSPPINHFWSSSSYVADPSSAWLTEFGVGKSSYLSKVEMHAVRCVRGGS